MQSLAIFKSGSLFELDEGRLPSFSNHHFRKIELPVSGRMWSAENPQATVSYVYSLPQ
jgi:hypothetical protein